MTINIKYFLFSLLCVAAFLIIRLWLDREREDIQDIDIVRPDMHDNDLHLGTWAQKNGNMLITFRLRRDGSFNYEVDDYHQHKSEKYSGKYMILPEFLGNDRFQYSRLLAVSDKGDTIINQILELTHATKRNIDVLSLKADKTDSASAMFFYRLKQ